MLGFSAHYHKPWGLTMMHMYKERQASNAHNGACIRQRVHNLPKPLADSNENDILHRFRSLMCQLLPRKVWLIQKRVPLLRKTAANELVHVHSSEPRDIRITSLRRLRVHLEVSVATVYGLGDVV